MRVAVVTPYFKEPLEVLQRCHDSVRAQTHADVTHILVADGHPRPEVGGWQALHYPLPVNHNDSGDTPRLVGLASAAARGFDAIALLDADNWFEPEHIAEMVAAQARTGAHVVTATRNLYRMDGTFMAVDTASDGVNFVDMNCWLFTKPAFAAFKAWSFKDPASGHIGDKILWSIIQNSNATRAHVTKPTVNYVTTYAVSYIERGETPPPGAKFLETVEGKPYPVLVDFWERQRAFEAAQQA